MNPPPGRARARGEGPRRYYTEAELALFASYRDHRAQMRPADCKGGAGCWVEIGPPGSAKNGHCRACYGLPRLLPASDR